MKSSHVASWAGDQRRHGPGRGHGSKTTPVAGSSEWRIILLLPLATLLLFCSHTPPAAPLTARDLLNGSAQYINRLQSARFSLQVDGPLTKNPYQLESSEGTVVR